MKNATDVAELRKFGLLVGTIVATLFGIVVPWLHRTSFPFWPWLVGLPVAASGACAPKLLRYPFLVWDTIGHGLGWLNSRIILNLLYFVIFLPAGMLARLAGWDPMQRRFNPAQPTYRVRVLPGPREGMEKPF